jgi:hypothetical protein
MGRLTDLANRVAEKELCSFGILIQEGMALTRCQYATKINLKITLNSENY